MSNPLDEIGKIEESVEEIISYYSENGPAALVNFVIVDVSHSLPFLKERKTAGGVVIPAPKNYDMEHNKDAVPFDGIVVSVGNECSRIVPGDHVCLPLNNNAMWMLNWKGKSPLKKYVVMEEQSIRAKF